VYRRKKRDRVCRRSWACILQLKLVLRPWQRRMDRSDEEHDGSLPANSRPRAGPRAGHLSERERDRRVERYAAFCAPSSNQLAHHAHLTNIDTSRVGV
jgi:hypothetical protein